MPFGEKNVIVTSFNNTVAFQRNLPDSTPYDLAYLDTITTKEEKAAIGSNFRISTDCGITFGKIFKSPVTSPHGPVELPDGTLLWVGRTFSAENTQMQSDCIQAHKINKDGTTAYVGAIENVTVDSCHVLSCEPHAIVLDDGSLLAHIRVQNYEHNIFTIFQSESKDNGKTWTKPKQVLSKAGGAPPHLFKHPSGLLICTYGFRGTRYGVGPFGVKAMFSSDNGKTWETDFDIYKNNESEDLGYPSTVSLSDGSLLTIFYARPQKNQPAVIMQQKWSVEL